MKKIIITLLLCGFLANLVGGIRERRASRQQARQAAACATCQ